MNNNMNEIERVDLGDGIVGIILKNETTGKFHVVGYDTDAEMYLPIVTICPTLELARSKFAAPASVSVGI